MEHLLENPETWVLVAFVIFVSLVARKASSMIASALDARADAIRTELESAARLREEAQSLLAQYQRQQRGVKDEVEAILEHARREGEIMTKDATARLAEQLSQRERQAKENIERNEAQVVDGLRATAAELAVAAAHTLVVENLDKSRAAALVDRSIEDVGQRLG